MQLLPLGAVLKLLSLRLQVLTMSYQLLAQRGGNTQLKEYRVGRESPGLHFAGLSHIPLPNIRHNEYFLPSSTREKKVFLQIIALRDYKAVNYLSKDTGSVSHSLSLNKLSTRCHKKHYLKALILIWGQRMIQNILGIHNTKQKPFHGEETRKRNRWKETFPSLGGSA